MNRSRHERAARHTLLLLPLAWVACSSAAALIAHAAIGLFETGWLPDVGAYAGHEHGAVLPAFLLSLLTTVVVLLAVCASVLGARADVDPLRLLAQRCAQLNAGTSWLASCGGAFAALLLMEFAEQSAAGEHSVSFANALGGNVLLGALLVALASFLVSSTGVLTARALVRAAIATALIILSSFHRRMCSYRIGGGAYLRRRRRGSARDRHISGRRHGMRAPPPHA